MAVRMELSRILIRELNDYPLVELREVAEVPETDANATTDSPGGPALSQVEGGRSFPIVIGLPEAYAIERALKGTPVRRPQTHDLLFNLLKALGGRLESVAITDLSEGTFYAELSIKTADGRAIKVDSRPSDAIALGVAAAVPMYVQEHVLKSAMSDGEN
ncbi:MAG: bifunctional nuclease family protein [bacterium]|jgi:bifunctional DNase/RNase